MSEYRLLQAAKDALRAHDYEAATACFEQADQARAQARSNAADDEITWMLDELQRGRFPRF